MVKYEINCIIFVLGKIMKFIGLLLFCCCVAGGALAQTPKPPPMKLGKMIPLKPI